MTVSSILAAGMQSMQTSINRATLAGSRLNAEEDDLAARMVAMQQGANEAKIAAQVIKTGDQMLGTVIDIRG